MERLTGLDATFLYLENPTNHMHVAMTMIIDPSTMPGGYSFDKIKGFIGSRLHLVPPFRRRLVEVPFNLQPSGLGRGSGLRPRLPHPPRRRPESGRPPGVGRDGRTDRESPARPLEAAVGALGDRRAQARPRRRGHEGAPLGHRRGIRSRPDGAPVRLRADRARTTLRRPTCPVEHIPNDVELIGYAAVSRLRRLITVPRLIGDTIQSVNRIVAGRRAPEHNVGAAPLTAPRTPWNGSLTAHRNVGLRAGLARRRQDDQERVRHDRQRRRARVVRGHPASLPARPRRASRRSAHRGLPDLGPRRREVRSWQSGLGDVHVAGHRHRRSGRSSARHPRGHQGRQGGASRRRSGHAAELGRVRRSDHVQHGVAPLCRLELGRHAPADPQRDHLQRAGTAVLAVLRRGRARGGVSDGPGDGRRRPEHHGVQLPRLRSTSASWSAESSCRTCGP